MVELDKATGNFGDRFVLADLRFHDRFRSPGLPQFNALDAMRSGAGRNGRRVTVDGQATKCELGRIAKTILTGTSKEALAGREHDGNTVIAGLAVYDNRSRNGLGH
jgi:hypothetical protein